MKQVLIVVDMQKDFVDGALGTAEAQQIVPAVVEKVCGFLAAEGEREVIFTRDTHQADYMETQEGRKLPVLHCVEGTEGWELIPQLQRLAEGCRIFDKPTFGSRALAEALTAEGQGLASVELIGLCTDICVISNAMLLKAFMPELTVKVDGSCCAGVTPESHENALAAMKMCQIEVN